jgi:hypothetical protein
MRGRYRSKFPIRCPRIQNLRDVLGAGAKLVIGGSRPTAGYQLRDCLYLLLPQFFDYRPTSSMYMILGPVHFYLYCLCTA